jgi:hypothetical protein
MPYSSRHHRSAPFTGLVEVVQSLAREAIVADVANCSLDARLVSRSAHTGGVDEEAARLRVLAEALDDLRLEAIGPGDDRLHVVDHHHAEDPAVERPGSLAGGDRLRRGLLLDRVDEAVARHVRREDESLLAPAYALVVGLQAQHPACVDLQLVARLAVGDRDGGSLAAKAELLHSETVQRRVRHLNALACQQPKDLGQPQTVPLRCSSMNERSASQAHHGSPWGCAAGCLSAMITALT